MSNYSHSVGSFFSGFFLFLFLIVIAVGLGSLMKEENIVEDPSGWIFIFACIGFYIALKFAQLIAKYQCGVAPLGWTSFFDKTSKAFYTTITLGFIFLVLGLIVGPKGGNRVFGMLILFAPIMSIYYAFLHQNVKKWVTAVFSKRNSQNTYQNQSSSTGGSWVKEKLVPTLISSTLPVILSYILTNNVTISISASLIGTLALFASGKD